jgi:hypothetical protein
LFLNRGSTVILFPPALPILLNFPFVF